MAIKEDRTIISQPFYGKGTQGESHNYQFQVVLGQGCSDLCLPEFERDRSEGPI